MTKCYVFRYPVGQLVPLGTLGAMGDLENFIQGSRTPGILVEVPAVMGTDRTTKVRCSTDEDVTHFKLKFANLDKYYSEVPCR